MTSYSILTNQRCRHRRTAGEPPDKSLADRRSGLQRSVVGPTNFAIRVSMPLPSRFLDTLPPPPPVPVPPIHCPQPLYPNWPDQMSFAERIRDATNASTSIMDPFEQDQLVAENSYLKRTLREYEMRMGALEEENRRLSDIKDCSLPQVSHIELKFLQRLTGAIGRCVNSKWQEWSQSPDQEAIQPGQSPVVENAAWSSMGATLTSHGINDKPEKDIPEDIEEEREVKVELVPGTGVMVTKTQYSTLLLQSKTKEARQFVRCVLGTLFRSQDLVKGCAVGNRHAHNKVSTDRSRPLDQRKVNALKVFVLRRYKECQLKDKDFNRIINCKCSELRATLNKAAVKPSST